jgi:hypothetical protein
VRGTGVKLAPHLGDGSVLEKPDFLKRINVICPVQSPLKKYFRFSEMQIRLYDWPSCPTEGRLEIVTDAGQDAVDARSAKDEGANLADGEGVWS